MRPPLIYYGSKTRLADHITHLLPDHTHYIEPYAGSLAVLLAKHPARMETANDLDGDLVQFWTMLRDRTEELERACALTPHSRTELTIAQQPLERLGDIERARRTWVRLTQARAGTMRATGWRYYANGAASSISMSRYLDGYQSRLAPVACPWRTPRGHTQRSGPVRQN
ncbi:DNA adenine methylase [Haloglycomyces albus]|uniref:DNA adenine methylase n=1 Tax=Haloglycomyces albus TaxID=526067 RepID=UPI00046CF1DF|nr:DNA adenine methylase [Haloglycomyces albus]